MATLRNRLIGSASTPTGIGIGSLYLATLEQGSDAQFLFRLGITCLIAAGVFARVSCINWRAEQTAARLSGQVTELKEELRHVTEDQQQIREDVGARRAAQAWRRAGATRDDLDRTLHLVHREEN